MRTWQQQIESNIENDDKHHYLKGIPLVLISAVIYQPPWLYWQDWTKANKN